MERLNAGAHKNLGLGHRTGSSPCAHSIGNFFLCFIYSFFPSETSAPGSPGNCSEYCGQSMLKLKDRCSTVAKSRSRIIGRPFCWESHLWWCGCILRREGSSALLSDGRFAIAREIISQSIMNQGCQGKQSGSNEATREGIFAATCPGWWIFWFASDWDTEAPTEEIRNKKMYFYCAI